MKIETFKAGRYVQQYQYKSFSPNLVNQEWTWDDAQINTLLEKATKGISELNAFSLIVPDIDRFISMHITKEANQSSRIEGTQTNMDDALKSEEEISPEKRDDWKEVRNYIKAMNTALEELERLPLSNRLIRETHDILMQSVRGERKTPGQFRTSQNWIGSSLSSAIFVPPHHEEVPTLMADLEKFLHNEKIYVPHLIRIAIAHYQFETIHPFLDGNGRIGRLLIPLYLISNGFLSKASLYLSDYFENHRSDYYDALMIVRTSNNLAHWIKFFLTAVIETSKKGSYTFQEILKLRSETETNLNSLGKKTANARILLDFLYKRPVVNTNLVSQILDISHQAASGLLSDLIELKILVEITGQKRNKIFVFEKYVALFRR